MADSINIRLNGHVATFPLADTRTTLLDLLREQFKLTGTKKGCDRGQCGACTVHVNERSVNACLVLAAGLDGHSVTTIEGVAPPGSLHPLQQAFIEHDAFQCGFCTPGQIMSAISLLREDETDGDPERIRERMSGNLCRCGAYAGIVSAIQDVYARSAAKRTGNGTV